MAAAAAKGGAARWSTRAALCVIPPQAVGTAVDAWRTKHDRSYGRWPPHVNLMFPFAEEGAFDGAAKALAAAVAAAGIAPFTVRLGRFDAFGGGGGGKRRKKRKRPVFFVPEVVPAPPAGEPNPWTALYAAAEAACPDFAHKQPHNRGRAAGDPAPATDFHPHLSVGQLASPDELTPPPTPLEFKVDRLYLVARDEEGGPFRVVTSVPLVGAPADPEAAPALAGDDAVAAAAAGGASSGGAGAGATGAGAGAGAAS